MFTSSRPVRSIVSPGFRYSRYQTLGVTGAFVEDCWVLEAARCRTAVEAALPDTSVEIYFNLGPTGRSLVDGAGLPRAGADTAWILGPRSETVLVAKEIVDSNIVGVRLRPAAAALVLGVPAVELRGTMVDLDRFWGPAVSELRDRLAATADHATRVGILTEAVRRRLAQAARHDEWGRVHGLCEALSGAAPTSVKAVADRFGLTHRQVIGLFDHHVGLKPKQYHRVRRFRRVLHGITAERQPWAQLAARSGYVDQAHLINEFRQLTGCAPRQYEANRSSVGVGFMPHRLAPHANQTSSPTREISSLQGSPIA